MSWLSSIVSGIFGIGQQAWQNAYASKEAQKNREFQSDEAEISRIFQSNEAALQRDWSAAEAERARDWQEEMNAKYNSISGKIAQAEQSGVNPLFAVTGNAVSPVSASGSVPSGASAGGVGTPSGATASAGLVNILGELMNTRKIDSEIAVNESIANKNNADANRTTAETPYAVQKLMSEIAELDERAQLHSGNLEYVLNQSKFAVKSLELSDKQIEHYDAIISKLESEVKTIDGIRDTDKRLKEAEAAVAEFDASYSEFWDEVAGQSDFDWSNFGKMLTKIVLNFARSK